MNEAHIRGADQLMLSDAVTLTRQFQRAVRLDADLGNVDALKGYICQGTARNVLGGTARQIVSTLHRTFTWTGPFGGGKSSLALALCSLVSPDANIRRTAFEVLGISRGTDADIARAFSSTKEGWLILPVVGYRGSVIDEIAACLDKHAGTRIVARTKYSPRQRIATVLSTIAQQAEARANNGVLLFIDELGKFLEASALEGDDIYFYQELADMASRCKGKVVVVGILHQSFEQYANRLSSDLRDEWRKVQGRYVDIPLVAASDEVVELTGRAIASVHPHPESQAISKRVADSIRHRRPSLSPTFAQSLDRCWPLHPVTAALLGPVSKRRFGQNERSTFGFLASVEARSLREFLQTTPVEAAMTYTPAAYWDYLRANLEPSILASPDSHRWSQSVEAIERAEQKQKQKDGDLHVQLVKTIALIDMFRNGSGLVADDDILSTCISGGRKRISTSQLREALQDLRRWAVVLYKRHLGSWCITEGSDFDLDGALSQGLAAIDEPNLTQLSTLVRLRPVLAKRHYCETGTLRWMLPVMTHSAEVSNCLGRISNVPCGEETTPLQTSAFGTIVLVLPSRNQTVRQALNAIRNIEIPPSSERPLLIGVPRNGESIRELGRELVAYEQIRRSRSELENDAVARRELDARTTDVRSRLEEELRDALLHVQWINEDPSPGLKTKNRDQPPTLPQLASALADRVFKKSPHIFSELINRDSPSSNSVKARRDLLYAMLRNGDKLRLGLEGYPAEAGLYYNLLHASGLHRAANEAARGGEQQRHGFFEPTTGNGSAMRAKSFVGLWKAAAKQVLGGGETVSISKLYDLWQAPPFGVRAGGLPVLCLAFILANQNRVAVYKDGMFIPQLREVDVDEILQDPGRFALKHVEVDEHRKDILQGISSHLKRLGQAETVDPLQAARGLVAIVYNLPPWVLRTTRLNEQTRAVRDTLVSASDPHKVLFVDLPVLFERQSVSEYVDALGDALEELLSAYENMLSHVLERTLASLDASLDSDTDFNLLHQRSKTVVGISGNLQLDAFATRLSAITREQTSVDGLLSLALNKPPRDWTDRDIDAALIQLAQWALQFRQVEAVSAVRDRIPTRNAIAVVFGTGHEGRLITESFDVSPVDDQNIEHLAKAIMIQRKGVRREVFLAALAQAGASLIEVGRSKETQKA